MRDYSIKEAPHPQLIQLQEIQTNDRQNENPSKGGTF